MTAVQHPPRVLQFGQGNFLRAFIDWMIQGMNERAGFMGSVRLAKAIPGPFARPFVDQGYAYNLVVRGREGGASVRRREKITCISGSVNAYEDFDGYLREAALPSLKVVVSNTTEAGIAFAEADKADDRPASSYPGKLTQLLRARFLALGGSKDSALFLLPCELIEKNGQTLKKYVLRHAERWYHDAAFTAWLTDDCTWFDSLVDRIVPGHDQEERARCAAETGLDDRLLVVAEPYHLFVIQGPEREDVLPLKKAGFNVIWTDDLTPYRTRKVRVLNGGHTFMAMVGLGMGVASVREALESPVLGRALDAFYSRELIPLMPFDREEIEAYKRTILDRFANPYMVHKLSDIALNSVAKYISRILPSVHEYVAKHDKAPEFATFGLAALLNRYLFTGGVVDDAPILEKFGEIAHARGANPKEAAAAVFASKEIWIQGAAVPAVVRARAGEMLASIRELGMEKALQALL
jgi:tagaturonate reductase